MNFVAILIIIMFTLQIDVVYARIENKNYNMEYINAKIISTICVPRSLLPFYVDTLYLDAGDQCTPNLGKCSHKFKLTTRVLL